MKGWLDMKIGIIGGGWRADFFLRIARELPSEFEIAGVARTSREKAKETEKKWGVPGCAGVDELLERHPEYVVLSVPRTEALGLLTTLLQREVPVLCETPPGASTEELVRLWEMARSSQTPLLVAEQYFLQPYHSANLRLIEEGALGEVVSMRNSMMHGYHGINIMRRVLGVGMAGCRISGRVDEFPITHTCGRGGRDTSGKVVTARRELFLFDFDGGKTGVWDFSGEQYFSAIRARHLSVEGVRGEIFDTTVRILDRENKPCVIDYRRVEAGPYSNLEGFSLQALELGGRRLWENPFPGARLSDDELAVASLMRNLRRHLQDGEALCYPLSEGLQDAYLSFCLDEAKQSGTVKTAICPWYKDR